MLSLVTTDDDVLNDDTVDDDKIVCITAATCMSGWRRDMMKMMLSWSLETWHQDGHDIVIIIPTPTEGPHHTPPPPNYQSSFSKSWIYTSYCSGFSHILLINFLFWDVGYNDVIGGSPDLKWCLTRPWRIAWGRVLTLLLLVISIPDTRWC